ncbi:hypothetical protein KY289_033877 [Solanum tuberosum]|nr:hypothetical protein KY289_033877 [Solanum tuberosum]
MAMAQDCDNSFYPLVWAVVDKETTRAWTWFLQLLEKSLNLKNGDSITFMSYMQNLTRLKMRQNQQTRSANRVIIFRGDHRGVMLEPFGPTRELESDLVLRPRIIFEELTRLKMRQNQQTRYANRVITFRGDHRGVNDSTNLLYSPTKVTWKGKKDMTSNQLNDKREEDGEVEDQESKLKISNLDSW